MKEDFIDGIDPWSTESDLYQIRGKASASNKANHSVTDSIRMDPSLAKRISKVCDHIATPYTSKSDFYRDAAIRLLEGWEKELNDPALTAYIRSETQKARMDDQLDDLDSAEDVLEHHRVKLERALQTGNESRLMVLIGFTQEDAESQPVPYNQRMLDLAEEYRKKLRK